MNIIWQGYEFKWIQGGYGVLTDHIAGHIHSKNSYEIHYIVRGKGTLLTEEKSYELSEGILFITGPDAYHEQRTEKDNPLTEVHCYLQASDKKTNDMLVNVFLEHTFYIKKQKTFKKYFVRMAEEIEHKYIGYESIVESCLNYVLTEYTRGLIRDYKIANLDSTSDLNDRRFLQIEMEFISNSEGVTLSSLAEKIGLCERQTQRLLRKYYGMNFLQIRQSLWSKQRKNINK